MTTTYEVALETIRKATVTFTAITSDYRSGKINDAEFLAAKAIYNAAEKEFDAVYIASQSDATFSLDSFTRAYIEAALWSSTDDNGSPLDANYNVTDIEPETLAKMAADCARFQQDNAQWITEESRKFASEWSTDELAGHDFWLTRNGHGAGFWDGDWMPFAGDALTKSSETFGECNLYVGDDSRLYVTP